MVTKNNSVQGPEYNPNETRPPTGNEDWQRWQFVYTGNARVPCWIVRVPKEIIWGHGGLWSDNSVAMFGALYRMHFPLNAEGAACSFSTGSCSQGSGHRKTEPGQTALKAHDSASAPASPDEEFSVSGSCMSKHLQYPDTEAIPEDLNADG